MASWIHVFSKFTDEALLFESLFICLICAAYAAFWVLKKRKYGVLGQQQSQNVVKGVLNELIFDAQLLREQLFGLLGTGEIPGISVTALRSATAGTTLSPAQLAALGAAGAGASAAAGATTQGPIDPAIAPQLAALEAKMAEQAKAMDTIVQEKTRLETELATAKGAGGKGAAAAPGSDDSKLQEKIAQLEAKLSEYSVIEDDLANLKRLQQENAQLKAQVANKGPAESPAKAATPEPTEVEASEGESSVDEVGSAKTAQAAPSPEEVAPTEVAAAEAPAVTETPSEVPAAAATEAVAETAKATEVAAAGEVAEPTADPNFEGLVDQVEQSLKPTEAATGASTTDPLAEPTPPVAEAAAAGATPNAATKSDADLVAEFEKMLNS